jgi:uncharacterized protein (TIGR02679 family)
LSQNWQTERARLVFGDAAWRRWLDGLRRACEDSHAGSPRGKVELSDATQDERDALDGFMGKLTKPHEPAILPIRPFERLLREYGLAPSLLELFEALDGKPILTRGLMREQYAAGWNGIFRRVRREVGAQMSPEAESWFDALHRREGAGARTLQRIYGEGEDLAVRALLQVLQALSFVEARKRSAAERIDPILPLPLLAARITGNAHGFDWKEAAGRLLWYGLEHLFGEGGDGGVAMEDAETGPSEGESVFSIRSAYIRSVYRMSGLADDDLSSQVLLFAPSWGGVWEERVLTLRQVEKSSVEPNWGDVYAVENPSVFAYLLAAVQERKEELSAGPASPILVCVSGQPSLAAVGLLDKCLRNAGKRRFYYAGDLDVKGLEIAETLARTYRESFVPWCMGTADFAEIAHRGMELTKEEKIRLAGMTCSWDGRLPALMLEWGRKAHQELLVEIMAQTWLKAWGLE